MNKPVTVVDQEPLFAEVNHTADARIEVVAPAGAKLFRRAVLTMEQKLGA